MSKSEIDAELRTVEEKLRKRYSLLSKLIFLLAIILTILIIIAFVGINSWAGLDLNSLVTALIAIFAFFIFLELIFFFHYSSVSNKRNEAEKPKIEFINGKRIYVYTMPKGKEGGIFSKTYIEIDGNNVIRLRSLMISPEELWTKKI